MASRDVVGGYPEGPGSEEAHRPPANRTDAGRLALTRGQPLLAFLRSGIHHATTSRRLRLQVAGLAAIVFVLLVATVLRTRDVRILADGSVTTVASRSANDLAIVERAGIDLEPGDRIEANGDGALVVRRAQEATLSVDGKTFALRTQAMTIGELLLEAGVSLGPQDSVHRNNILVSTDAEIAAQPSLTAVPQTSGAASERLDDAPVALEVRRAMPFSVIENGQELRLRSSRETVAAALRDVGVRLGPGDAVQPFLSTELSTGLQVHVEHATQVVVTLPEGKATLYTLANSAGGALAESGIEMPADYRLEPAADTPISAGLTVHVVGISREQELETVRIESYTVYEPDPGLPPGATRVSPGQDGVLYRQFAAEYHDGALVSRDLAAEWYDPLPVDTIVYYSTAQPSAPSSSPALAWTDLACSYNWDCDWALAVIQCESGGNPNAYNPAGYVGLFQIWEGHGANLSDPATNIAAAYSLYVSGGPGNWPNCP